MLKENIVLKSASAPTNFAYTITGAGLTPNKDGGFDVAGTKQTFAPLSVSTKQGGPTSDNVVSQHYQNGTLSIKPDSSWLKAQPANQFPVVIDPSWSSNLYIGGGYTAYKSDGYSCGSSTRYMNAGTVNSDGWKSWRTIFSSTV